MHLTNVPRYRNRFHPRYPAPSSGEVRTFQGDVERVERTSREWSDRKVCSRRELEPSAGSLNHAGKVVSPVGHSLTQARRVALV